MTLGSAGCLHALPVPRVRIVNPWQKAEAAENGMTQPPVKLRDSTRLMHSPTVGAVKGHLAGEDVGAQRDAPSPPGPDD